MSLFTSFNAGVSGIQNAQAGLNTTAHNLANTKTPGFTRQQNINSDTYYMNLKVTQHDVLQVGYGTQVADVRQIRDIFLDSQYRLEVGRQSFYEVQYTTEQEVEDILGEMEGVEFHDALQEMWNTIQSLSTDPANITKRELLIAEAEAFLDKAQDAYDALRDYQVNLNTQIRSQVTRINAIADRMVELNLQIAEAEASGLENANDYRDERNLLLDELAGYTAFDAYEDNTGKVTVRINNAPLVDEQRAYHMECEKIQMTEPRDTDGDGNYDRDPATGDLIYYPAGSSPMYTVVWEHGGYGEVYNVDKAFSTENDSDVGSLLSILVARGTKYGYYTDIPQNIQDMGDGQLARDLLNDYNNSIGNCMLERVEAQLDLLVHKVVTAINDAFAPNTTVDLTGVTTDANGATLSFSNHTVVLDASRCLVGTDDDATPGTEVFSRKNGERYTVYTLTQPVLAYKTDENGNRILDENGNPIQIEVTRDIGGGRYELYVYNEEDPHDVDTQYTLQNLEMNRKLLGDYNYLPVQSNPGSYNWNVYEDMLASWKEKDLILDPNSMTKYGADEFYDNMIHHSAVLGSVWSSMVDSQESLVQSIEDKRQQVSGVSTEEEMVSMLMYQHAFNAASRYITTIDDMLRHIIERLG